MNLKEIEELGPCTEGWDNLVKHYPKWKGTLLEFMDLDKIPDEDKVWLFADCIIDNDIKKEFAFICAETAMQHTDKKEIHTFHTLNLLDYESGTYDYATRSAANSVAEYADDYFTYSAARSAARKDQVDIIKNLLEEKGEIIEELMESKLPLNHLQGLNND